METILLSILDWVLSLLSQLWLPVLLICGWWWISEGSQSYYFPPLSEILSALWTDLIAGPLLGYVCISLSNLAAGLAIATMLGISFGLLIGEFDTMRQITQPTLNFFRAVPPASIVPIVIIALGVGATPKIFIIALGCFWPILLNTIDGVRGTSLAVRDTARAYRIPTHLVVFRVALPAAMPQIMAGIRVALAVALVLMVISEFFGADAGVGFYITEASTRFATRQAWAGTILVGIIGYLLSGVFLQVERRVLGWYFRDTNRSAPK
ncbi:ABC transporter permease [Agrobacterium rhizogenes]|uniref:ABC transporter, permease protein n=1 Tax=Rhizobium rhizogenes (strain K84 / ATCC BAA-868) TaxID=311403 RepID=B9JQB4_RHIR8|nr:ABC transporter permease [Rhizobium rhizogenes]ACM31333.1 ABC transporter, permease protein [Rhizobium rhizogenes K84]OCJ22070.1 ABC transporter permease [Agrobacterium sp. B131/95]OCJ24413.1 ABC transporter permease [Agrobacterium sp. B133/95]NTI46282.1 ABC transporter permease [Rhizobium rhizogenes]NTI52965.1 ABC transporter permease [Rhizobium rhizogenes]